MNRTEFRAHGLDRHDWIVFLIKTGALILVLFLYLWLEKDPQLQLISKAVIIITLSFLSIKAFKGHFKRIRLTSQTISYGDFWSWKSMKYCEISEISLKAWVFTQWDDRNKRPKRELLSLDQIKEYFNPNLHYLADCSWLILSKGKGSKMDSISLIFQDEKWRKIVSYGMGNGLDEKLIAAVQNQINQERLPHKWSPSPL